MKTETLTTERLILRRFRPEDARALHENCSCDERTVRFLTRGASSDPAQTEKLVTFWLACYEQDDFLLWAIEWGGQVIGSVNLHDVCREKGRCEIGFSIGSRWWNQGIMTEAAGAVVQHALDGLKFERVEGWCAAGNAASARVMEKIGMLREAGPHPAIRLSDGTEAEQIRYFIGAEDGTDRTEGKA